MANLARGYNVYDTIRRALRDRRYATSLQAYGAVPQTGDVIGGTPGVISGATSTPTSPFLSDTEAYVKEGEKTRKVDVEALETGLKTADKVLSPGEAAIEMGTPYGTQKYEDTTMGKLGSALLLGADPSFMGMMSSLVGGRQVQDPYGTKTAVPGGVLGLVAEQNIEKQYEVAQKIKEGAPGYHQFYQAGQLVSIVPQNVFGYDLGYAPLGATTGEPQDVINQYAAMYGYDPSTVDLSKRPNEEGFGVRLEGFVKGSGGFNQQGDFVGYNGQVQDLSVESLEAHIGLVNSIQGPAAAINALTRSSMTPSVKDQMISAVESGGLTAKQVFDNDGNLVGFETGLGSVVKSSDGIVTTSDGQAVTSGAGILSARAYERAQQRAEAEASESGVGMGEGLVEGYTTVSGATSEEDKEPQTDAFFAEGGPVPPDQVPAGNAPVVAQAGFVGQEPEGLPDGMTVADDVPVEVQEGTFVLNAPAVEFMGSADVKKMILDAMKEAEKQGIDINQQNAKIPKEELVSLVVSKGEVIIPPKLAEIIGYDRLNKINNRGKAEVEKRAKQQEQQPQEAPKPPILAKSGGFISKTS